MNSAGVSAHQDLFRIFFSYKQPSLLQNIFTGYPASTRLEFTG